MKKPNAVIPTEAQRSGGTSNTNCTVELPECSANANGVLSISPGLRAARYPWCRGTNRTNPERVSSSGGSRTMDSTPTGLALILGPKPRVARSSQPWPDGWNAIGVQPTFVRSDCGNRITSEGSGGAELRSASAPRRLRPRMREGPPLRSASVGMTGFQGQLRRAHRPSSVR